MKIKIKKIKFKDKTLNLISKLGFLKITSSLGEQGRYLSPINDTMDKN